MYPCRFGLISIYNPSINLTNPSNLLPPELWLEIFQFATYVHREATIVPLDPFSPRRVSNNVMAVNSPSLALRTKLSLVLVCRFWRQLSISLLYRHVVIRSPSRAQTLLKVLRLSSESTSPLTIGCKAKSIGYGYWTRYIEIYTHARGSHHQHYLQTILHILQSCPNLSMLSGSWNHDLPLAFLSYITRFCGQSLHGLSWSEHRSDSEPYATLVSPVFLATFQNLRVLDLRNIIGCDPTEYEKGSRPTLPFVQDLILSTHARGLQVATALILPSLRNLTLRTSMQGTVSNSLVQVFLKVHGASLINIDLPPPSPDIDLDTEYAPSARANSKHIDLNIFLEDNVCPNLTTFTYPITSAVPNALVHNNLRRIGLRGVRADGLYPETVTATDTTRHLMAVTPSRYPKLEIVRTVGFLVDADMDTLLKHIFIWWVERFEKVGIDFLDGEGILWAYSDPEEMQGSDGTGRGKTKC
ncbi:hypothetical protein AMATHDRAFT_76006 [Amanita thiersii Skay4041]|uniref:Uncharacterized protein n=1 Tax=Amanita thiersii Skay4041 TaxID=703135 RepID=A0A2A9NPX9_9AGAR|nr:hypothetical protein AMATHDRAFT_76006 [Amanita thiersii Skay4041]